MPPRAATSPSRSSKSKAAVKTLARADDPAAVRRHVGMCAKPNDIRAAAEVLVSVVGYFACFCLPSAWWPLSIPLHALFSMRCFIVCTHDAAHGALFSSKLANDITGTLCAPLTAMTYGYWKSGHGYHHSHSNDLDFLQTSQTAPFTSRTFASFPAPLRTAYRILSTPIALMTTGAPLMLMVVQPLSAERALDWAVQIAWWLGLYHAGVLRHFLTMGLLAAAIGLLLFHTQHTFPECVRSHGRTATPDGYYDNAIHGSSFLHLNEFLKFFTVGIEYHHIVRGGMAPCAVCGWGGGDAHGRAQGQPPNSFPHASPNTHAHTRTPPPRSTM